MRDPLNPVELEQFLQNFRKTFLELYQQALKSGAIEPQEEQSYVLAKCVLIIAAHKYEPTSKRHKEFLQNLQQFI